MVGATVAEGKLVGVQPEGAAEQLVAEADAVQRTAGVDHHAHLRDVRVHRAGIARAVGEQHAVGREGVDLRRRGVVREDGDDGPGRLEEPHDRGLGPVIEHDHVTAPAGVRSTAELARDLVRQQAAVEPRTFEITFLDPGVRAYVFTFG